MNVDAILFDFDGVLIDSEWAGNRQIADYLTAAGYPTRTEDAIDRFMGLAGAAFEAAIEQWIGAPLPPGLREARMEAGMQFLRDGIAEVDGATAFVRSLPGDLPIAVTSAASTRWIAPHVANLGLTARFGPHLYSGREHVARMKPAPDIYLFAAEQLGVSIDRALIIEDSPVGIEGALASGAKVVGLTAGTHARDGHDARLRAAGATDVAASFAEIAERYL